MPTRTTSWTPYIRLLKVASLCAAASLLLCGGNCNKPNNGSAPPNNAPNVVKPPQDLTPVERGKLTVAPEVYQQMVSAFTTGTLALQTSKEVAEFIPKAEEYLVKATQLVPREPAAWINLARLRQRQNKPVEMIEALETASKLMPTSSEVEAHWGYLLAKTGQTGLPHFQKAAELDPSNIQAQYAIAEERMRVGEPAGLEEAQKSLTQALNAEPNNLFLQLTFAKCAAQRNDSAGLKAATEMLRKSGAQWSGRPKELLASLSAKTANPSSAVGDAGGLSNLLLNSLVSQRDQSRAKLENPLETFLGLPPAPANPAPLDDGLKFVEEPIATAGSETWTFARTLSLTPELPDELAKKFKSYNLTAKQESPAVTLFANGRFVQIVGKDGKPMELSFPGGAQAKAPSQDGVLTLDFSYDFKPDFALAGAGGFRLYKQNATGGFDNVTAKMGIPSTLTNAPCYGVYAFDVDVDGDLDIIIAPVEGAPTVLRNNMDGTWKSIPLFSEVKKVRAFAWIDLNFDAVGDVVFVDEQGKIHAYRNDRGGIFTRLPNPQGVAQILALTAADVTRTGTVSLLALLADGAIQRLTYQAESNAWETAEIARWQNPPKDGSAKLACAELDNNGALDLIATGSAGSQVWLADPESKFQPLGATLPTRNLFVPFLSEQGRLHPLGLSAEGKPVLLRNQGTKNYHWLDIRPRADFVVPPKENTFARGSDRINSFGIGGELELRAGLLYQKQQITAPTIHYGIGEYTQADAARILWPNGYPRTEFALQADQMIVAPYRLGGSCPWLYAWDGEKMKLVTDCIWRSPLGMRVNAQGGTAPVSQTRDRIRIRGDQLKPREGLLDLSICAELWETHFFDEVALFAVDHPVGTEVYVDERFTIPQPSMEVVVTKPVRPVLRATDDNGKDVTDIVRARDERYLDTFERGLYQGVARDHYVEVELSDDAPLDKPLYLIATGWLHPTDSAINVALSQGDHPKPTGLSLEIPNGKGGWKTAKPGLGFPTGKIKTVVLNITGLFAPNSPRKLRLRTNLEIYWDSVGWAEGLPNAPKRIVPLELRTAELRYRGFSATRQTDFSSPEIGIYDRIASTAPQWLDLEGYYTRFGDVRPLLAKTDDRYVIMNAGDEMKLRFVAPAAPASGWTRDYLMDGDGWVKDGNFHTAFSKTVHPLPTHARADYDTPPKRLEDDPVYQKNRADWETYHTRYVSPDAFLRSMLPQANRR